MKSKRILWLVSWSIAVAVLGGVTSGAHVYNGLYTGSNLDRVAFPMGGIGAGMICLEGTGMLSHYSLHNHPDIFREEKVFAAVCVKGTKNVARVLEGPVPKWKIFAIHPGTGQYGGPGNGLGETTYGLPRFREPSFNARFPFGTVTLTDPKMPNTFSPADFLLCIPAFRQSTNLV